MLLVRLEKAVLAPFAGASKQTGDSKRGLPQRVRALQADVAMQRLQAAGRSAGKAQMVRMRDAADLEGHG
jgi:hypothetical protein